MIKKTVCQNMAFNALGLFRQASKACFTQPAPSNPATTLSFKLLFYGEFFFLTRCVFFPGLAKRVILIPFV